MKKLISASLAMALLAGTPALAQFVGPSAGAAAGPTTVREAAEANSDTDVVLTGHIIAHQRDDYFTFKDDTGTMTVEIERHAFRRQKVTPETKVRLTGEVERGIRGRYIDVDRVEIVE